MIFYGKGMVWDAENSKPLGKFVNGELETEDKRTIGILTGLGYLSDSLPDDDGEPEPDDTPPHVELVAEDEPEPESPKAKKGR